MRSKKKGKVSKKKIVTSDRGKKKTVARRKISKKKVVKKPTGYSETESGMLVPDEAATPVPASKLRTGFKKARKEIDSIVEEIVSTMTDDYVISEIELAASFSADGKFMGFGVGGAATIKIKITPDRQ